MLSIGIGQNQNWKQIAKATTAVASIATVVNTGMSLLLTQAIWETEISKTAAAALGAISGALWSSAAYLMGTGINRMFLGRQGWCVTGSLVFLQLIQFGSNMFIIAPSITFGIWNALGSSLSYTKVWIVTQGALTMSMAFDLLVLVLDSCCCDRAIRKFLFTTGRDSDSRETHNADDTTLDIGSRPLLATQDRRLPQYA